MRGLEHCVAFAVDILAAADSAAAVLCFGGDCAQSTCRLYTLLSAPCSSGAGAYLSITDYRVASLQQQGTCMLQQQGVPLAALAALKDGQMVLQQLF